MVIRWYHSTAMISKTPLRVRDDLNIWSSMKIKFPYWLISDLIPKKSEKFEFRKNFVTIFFSVKNWPKKWNFDFFCPRNFRKIAKLSSKFRSGQFTWKMRNFEKTHFASESALNSVCMQPQRKKFLIHESKVMKHFQFLAHQRF